MQVDQILIYDNVDYQSFYPFSVMHPAWELRAGALRIFEKYKLLYPDANLCFYSENAKILHNFLNIYGIEKNHLLKLNTLIVPASFNPSIAQINILNDFYSAHKKQSGEQSFVLNINGNHRILYLMKHDIDESETDFNHLVNKLSNNTFASAEYSTDNIINSLWEMIDSTGKFITEDIQFFRSYAAPDKSNLQLVSYSDESSIYMGKNVKIEPFVFLDTSLGEIFIDDGSVIMSHSLIQGPCYIGKNCIIKSGAKIYHNTSIGEFCKIGGEVENSVFQSYSNKQHDGFIGHSFISEWVNLGAGTNNSDLKNTYSSISIEIANNKINTGKMFLGMLMGDHSKSAIGSRFNTGTVIGACANIVCAGFPPKFINSFSFGGEANSPVCDFSKAIATAKKVKERRNRQLSNSEIELLQAEFLKTKNID